MKNENLHFLNLKMKVEKFCTSGIISKLKINNRNRKEEKI
jgi:hypothetical protein